MNCLQVRRLLLVEPLSEQTGLWQHLAQCPGCAREAERAWRLELALCNALVTAPVDAAAPTTPPRGCTKRRH